jgi:1,4-dihydroxy-6-naphthoate synthase
MKTKTLIRIAHSPDADDAFMFYGLAKGLIPSDDFEFTHVLSDIETLNRKALAGEYELTAISVHAYPYVSEHYNILKHGASVGYKYGPLLVSTKPISADELSGKTIAIPGTMTTAYLVLKLFLPAARTVVVPFDQIVSYVESGKADVGLIIHEGQLTYASQGLHKILDFGEWWYDETKLPLPLGVNAVKKNFDMPVQKEIARIMKESIAYSQKYREEALQYALQFSRGLETKLADRFVGMYVNEETLEMSQDTQRAIDILLTRAYKEKLIPQPVKPIFV